VVFAPSGVPKGNRAPRHEVPAAYWALLGQLIVQVPELRVRVPL